ncbi:hypothetical protein ACKLNQ_01225 [Myroides odoratimimus]|uniref:hypothetical protein n=1 Tax=Myroides odoratimimus TaxID=76832 RepID=UPI0038D3BC08
MKKYLILCFAALALSCSKSDDNTPKGDPIFDSPYSGLKSLDELPVGTLKYAGNKIGSQPVGLIGKDNKTCKQSDYLLLDMKREVLTYHLFEKKVGNICALFWDFPEEIILSELKEIGKLPVQIYTKIKRAPTKEELEINPDKTYYIETKLKYNGELEVGFQAGYLRIEDKMSNSSEGSLNKGKSYLYFHIK